MGRDFASVTTTSRVTGSSVRRRSLECAELWRDYGQAMRQRYERRDADRDADPFHLEITVMLPAVPVCCTRSKSTTALR